MRLNELRAKPFKPSKLRFPTKYVKGGLSGSSTKEYMPPSQDEPASFVTAGEGGLHSDERRARHQGAGLVAGDNK